nr:hypothetical protein [Klebsiella michiganensis]
KIGPDPRNFNQRVSLGRNDLLIRTFLNSAQFTDEPGRIYEQFPGCGGRNRLSTVYAALYRPAA